MRWRESSSSISPIGGLDGCVLGVTRIGEDDGLREWSIARLNIPSMTAVQLMGINLLVAKTKIHERCDKLMQL